MAMDQVPDVMRTVGVAVLSHEMSHDLAMMSPHGSDVPRHGMSQSHGMGRWEGGGYRETLQMLKHMFTWLPKQVRETTIEEASSLRAIVLLRK